MDHIPLPHYAIRGHPLIPLLTDDYDFPPFDSCAFEDYPAQAGFSKTALFDWSDEDMARREAFAQRWLFFGLLHCVLGEPYRQQDFITSARDANGLFIRVLSTANLLSLAENMAKQRLGDMVAAITASNVACENLRWINGFGEDLLLCLQLLGSLLDMLIRSLATDSLSRVRIFAWRPRLFSTEYDTGDCRLSGITNVLERRMLDAGWCPNRITHIGGLWAVESSYYFSLMRRPEGSDHVCCTRLSCKANRIDRASYSQAHVEADCKCELLSVNAVRVDEVLRTDGMQILVDARRPFEELKEIPITGVRLENEDAASVRYVAISHVWSHGLGNPLANALPRCQLSRLRRMVMSLSGTGPTLPFWIDTVCCPVERSGKKRVIPSMRKIYKAAASVLVLDNDLSRMALKEMELVERMVRIAASDWTGRLWTLQEGLLAGEEQLVFQFQDTLLGVGELQMAVRDVLSLPGNTRTGMDQKMFEFDLQRILYTLIGDEAIRARGARLDGLNDVVRAFANRSTSDPTDELLCAATLLGTPEMEEVISTDPDSRMQVFWRVLERCGGIPAGILFWKGECHRIPGFRWAPLSFFGLTGFPFDRVDCKVQALTDRGLQVRCSGIKLRKSRNIRIHKAFGIMGAQDETWSHLVMISAYESVDSSNGERFIMPPGLDSRHGFALILSEDPADCKDPDRPSTTLVYIEEERDGIIFARRTTKSGHCRPVKGRNAADSAAELMDRLERRSTMEASHVPGKHCLVCDERYTGLVGHWTAVDQVWCID